MPMMGQDNSAWAGVASGAGAPPKSGVPPTGGGGKPPSLGDTVGKYETPIPDITQKYLANLNKGMIDLPSFQEMYQSYRDVAQEATDRSSAKITEAFGSEGGRYSSDLLNAEKGLQRDLNKDLRSNAANFQLGLRQQQAGEVAKATDYLNSRDILGMSYLWQDYLRRTSPPPLLGAGAAAAGSPPGPVAV